MLQSVGDLTVSLNVSAALDDPTVADDDILVSERDMHSRSSGGLLRDSTDGGAGRGRTDSGDWRRSADQQQEEAPQ